MLTSAADAFLKPLQVMMAAVPAISLLVVQITMQVTATN